MIEVDSEFVLFFISSQLLLALRLVLAHLQPTGSCNGDSVWHECFHPNLIKPAEFLVLP